MLFAFPFKDTCFFFTFFTNHLEKVSILFDFNWKHKTNTSFFKFEKEQC